MKLLYLLCVAIILLVVPAQAIDERYHFRPVTVRAMEVTEWEVACDSDRGYYDWVKFHPEIYRNCKEKRLEVRTGTGLLSARVGDWIVLETPYNHMRLEFHVFTGAQFKRLFEKDVGEK